MSESRLDTIVCYGDSQTAGFSWGNRLPALSKTITSAIGRGVSGQEAGSVAIRQGGIVLTTTAAATIAASTEPVLLAVEASVKPCNIRSTSSDMPMVLAGVRGTVTVLAAAEVPDGMPTPSRANGVFTARFVPDAAPSSPVAVPSGTALVSQDVANHPEYAECLHIIWVGGNDAAFAGATRVTGVVSAVRAMVDKLKATVDEPRFLVASRTVWTSETEGTAGYQTAVDQRDSLAEAFPDNAIDIWGHVRDTGLDTLGITPTDEDKAALAGKSMPPSLTSDGIHYSTATREKVVAPFIIQSLADRGWTVPKKEVPPVAEYMPTNWENAPSKKTPLSAENLNNIETGVVAATEAAYAAAQGVADLRESKADKTALDAKLTVADAAQKNKVYGTGVDGKTYLYPLAATSAAANTVVGRTRSGNILVADTPAEDGHATSKKYVDTVVAAVPVGPKGDKGDKGDPGTTAAGTAAMLAAGTDKTQRTWSAKDIADFVKANLLAE